VNTTCTGSRLGGAGLTPACWHAWSCCSMGQRHCSRCTPQLVLGRQPCGPNPRCCAPTVTTTSGENVSNSYLASRRPRRAYRRAGGASLPVAQPRRSGLDHVFAPPLLREAAVPEVQMLQAGLQRLAWGGIRLVDVELAAGKSSALTPKVEVFTPRTHTNAGTNGRCLRRSRASIRH